MEKYLGVKIVHAEPMTNKQFTIEKFNGSATVEEIEEGYKVVYEDGYESWSPKEVFEKAYRRFDESQNRVDINVDPRDGNWNFAQNEQCPDRCVSDDNAYNQHLRLKAIRIIQNLAARGTISINSIEGLIEETKKILAFLKSK